MATAVAHALEFSEQLEPVTTLSRKEAIALARDGQPAIHEQIVDPRIYRAAAGLIEGHRSGRKVDIEAYGFPYDVLENVADQLQAMGASHYVSTQILGALEDYVINLGSDFSREAKAKPLYARIMVTNAEPDDLPECQQTQATMIDGVRKIGGEAARVNVQATVFGTKSTTSQGVDLNQMFASKTDGLFVFFGSPTNEAIKGFDSVDNGLVNLMQGLGGGVGGGAVSAATIEEIKQMIKSGEATPEVLKLLENIAGLKQLTEAMMTPGAVENGSAKLTELMQQITQQIASGIENGTVPQTLVQASIAMVADMQHNEVLAAIMTVPSAAPVAADNDNQVAAEKPAAVQASVVDQLPELAQQGAADLKQMIDALKQSPALPEALAQIIEKIDPATITVEQLTEALKGQVELATDVQQLILTLNDPEIKQALPQETLNSVNQFAATQPELVEAVTTVAVIQSLQTALPALEANSPEAAQIQQVINDLKSGVETIQTITPDKIAPVAQKLEGTPAAQMLNQATQTITQAQAAPVVLASETVAVIAAVADAPGIDPATKEALTEALKNGDQKVVAEIVKANPTLLEKAPAEVRPALEQAAKAADIDLPTPVDPVVTQTLRTLADSPLVSPEVKAEITRALESGDPKDVEALLKQQPVVAAAIPVTDAGTKGTDITAAEGPSVSSTPQPRQTGYDSGYVPPPAPSPTLDVAPSAPAANVATPAAPPPPPANNNGGMPVVPNNKPAQGNGPQTSPENKAPVKPTDPVHRAAEQKKPDAVKSAPSQPQPDKAKKNDNSPAKPVAKTEGKQPKPVSDGNQPHTGKPALAVKTGTGAGPEAVAGGNRTPDTPPKDNADKRDVVLKDEFVEARDNKVVPQPQPETRPQPVVPQHHITPAEIIQGAPVVPGAGGDGGGNKGPESDKGEADKPGERKKGGRCCDAFDCANCGVLSEEAEKIADQELKAHTDRLAASGKTYAIRAATLN